MAHDSPKSAQAALQVDGMDCASCVGHVEAALRSTPGVEACQVNLARGRAVVRYRPDLTNPNLLAQAITQAGYQARPEAAGMAGATAEQLRQERHLQHARQWLRRAVVGCLLWAPVETAHWTTGHAHGANWLTWWSLAAGTLALILVGGGFYRSAWAALRRGTTSMDTLIAMGATVAWGYSAVALGGWLAGWWPHLPDLYFMEAAGLLALISLGHWLEARARHQAGSAIASLMSLAPIEAMVRDTAGQFTPRPIGQIEPGDSVLVRPGDHVAVDGIVTEGESEVDESMLTGESLPIPKQRGDAVTAGTANLTGRLVVRARRVGSDTALAKIIELVETAQSAKPPVQRLADRISAVFVPAVLAVALLTAGGWCLWGHLHDWSAAATAAMAAKAACSVLIIACPCALGLAVPATLMVGLGRGARGGILIRDIDALQLAEQIDTVVLDKTGTVTTGRPRVLSIHAAEGWSPGEVLRLAASAEQFSAHPLAKAVVEHARTSGVELDQPASFTSLSGLGVEAVLAGRQVLAGSLPLLRGRGIDATESPAAVSRVHVACDGRHAGWIDLADTPRPDSAQAVAALHAMGLRTVLLTGDRREIAAAIAREVGIDDVRAEVPPDGKAQIIRELRLTRRVAMVGDGVNDAPALAAADLGIAIGGGSDVARETGGIVLTASSLRGIPTAVHLSRATMRKIRQNLVLAFAYNVLAIPLAAAGLLNPLIAAAAMALSDVTVLGNALLLRRSRID